MTTATASVASVASRWWSRMIIWRIGIEDLLWNIDSLWPHFFTIYLGIIGFCASTLGSMIEFSASRSLDVHMKRLMCFGLFLFRGFRGDGKMIRIFGIVVLGSGPSGAGMYAASNVLDTVLVVVMVDLVRKMVFFPGPEAILTG